MMLRKKKEDSKSNRKEIRKQLNVLEKVAKRPPLGHSHVVPTTRKGHCSDRRAPGASRRADSGPADKRAIVCFGPGAWNPRCEARKGCTASLAPSDSLIS